MNKISVRQSEDRFYWWVFFECCGERSMRMHDWTFAMQVANAHARGHATATSDLEVRDSVSLSEFRTLQDHIDALDLYVVLTAGANSSPSKTAEKLECDR